MLKLAEIIRDCVPGYKYFKTGFFVVFLSEDMRSSLPTTSVPPMVYNFVCRQKECDEIISHITSESTRIVSIFGQPGCEKSSVAIAVAHDLQSQRLPVYYLSLRGVRTKSELTSKLLSLVKQPASNDESLTSSLSVDEQGFQRFTEFSDRCVLVLDNADDLLGIGLLSVKEEVVKLLEELLMRNRILTLVVTTLESLESLNLLSQDLKAVRSGPLDEALKLELASISDSVKTLRLCISSDGLAEKPAEKLYIALSLYECTECLNKSLLKIRGLPGNVNVLLLTFTTFCGYMFAKFTELYMYFLRL